MVKNWSNKYDKCQNCGTVRFNHIAKGYCKRCYALIKQLEQVNCWDLSSPQTLKRYPRNVIFHRQDVFKKIKKGYVLQIKKRLVFLKTKEESLSEPVYGVDIEHQLQRIAKLCYVKNKRLFHGRANYIDHNFNKKQKKILYKLLNEIEENIPRKINWSKIFQK